MILLHKAFHGLTNSKIKAVVFLLLLTFYSSLILHQIRLPAADDLGRHLKNGEMIVSGELSVLRTNTYSYTEPDMPFANHHWLFGVIAYFIHQSVGFGGIVIFKTFILLLAFSLLFLVALKKANFWLVAFFSVPTILILMERTGFRPEIFSYLFIATYLYFLTGLVSNPRRSKIFWLVPFQIVWVNIHIFFVIGVALVAGFLFEMVVLSRQDFWRQIIVRKLTLLFALVMGASLINPHGIQGALLSFPLNIKGESPIQIAEDIALFEYLKGTYFLADIAVAIYIPLVIILALSFLYALRRITPFYVLASATTSLLGFIHLRGLALFGLIFLPSITTNLNPLWLKLRDLVQSRLPNGASYLGHTLLASLVILIVSLTVFHDRLGIQRNRNSGIGLVQWANKGGEFFNAQNLKGPVFNDADVGSYLIYHLYPRERVFVDNRFGDAYSSTFLKDVYLPMIAHEEVWQEYEERYGFQTIYFYQYDQVTGGRAFLHRRMHDPAWALVYADVYSLIFVRNTLEHQALIQKFHITSENALITLGHLLNSNKVIDRVAGADILFLLGWDDLAMRAYIDIVTRWPREDSVWMVMGEIELRNNTPQNSLLGVMFLEKALSLGRKTAEVYSFLGLGYLRLEQLQKGREMLKKALSINPERVDAKNFLEQLDARLKTEGIKLREI